MSLRMLAVAACLSLGMLVTVAADAAESINNPPPGGQQIFSLDGQSLPHVFTSYTVNFVATDAITNLSFSFREDPAYFAIDNIALNTGGGANFVVNGNFEQGPVGSNTPAGFTYLNLYNASSAGQVSVGCGTGGSNCYYDGAVGSYDSITQAVSTTIGSLYTLSFDLRDSSSQAVGSAVQTGDLSGINLAVYAGALPTVVTTAAPEPATWGLLIVGAGAAGCALRRRRTLAARSAIA